MFKMALGYFPESASNLNSIVNTGSTLPQLSSAFVNSQAFANVFNGGVILDPNQHLVAGSFTTNLIDSLFNQISATFQPPQLSRALLVIQFPRPFSPLLDFADVLPHRAERDDAVSHGIGSDCDWWVQLMPSASTLAGHTAH